MCYHSLIQHINYRRASFLSHCLQINNDFYAIIAVVEFALLPFQKTEQDIVKIHVI